MTQKTAGKFLFVGSVAVYHVVTYFVAGFIASSALDYAGLFLKPVIRDYYLPPGSAAFWIGPLAQVGRGLLLGLVLLPLRAFLAAERLGWLWLWLLFVGIGILGTPAAAPASIEGVLYTKIPLWFHLTGLPEIVLQTLAFSFLVHRNLRAREHPLPAPARRALAALVRTCLSFLGYTAVSVCFALAAGVGITPSGASLSVLGQFVAPLVFTFGLAYAGNGRRVLAGHAALYLLSACSLGLYQRFVLGSAGLAYVLAAPVLPVLISLALSYPGENGKKG